LLPAQREHQNRNPARRPHMNRINQGKVTKVEAESDEPSLRDAARCTSAANPLSSAAILKGKDGQPEPLPDRPQALPPEQPKCHAGARPHRTLPARSELAPC
jgi:hypothetical protein